ncbi:sugar ABC transporter permease [Muricomes sp. OA1]|uniref:Sugar ABC transporter permease n=1 Tax=Hungatella hathewayi TaxID=154046 RepID=A0A3E2WY08_9FIRM|nr:MULTISPECIES: sugar ABC transporter permease [Clostridia]MCH1974616.1 sugar ABC transporter permease [Muricomes sp. OA1]RGC33051.1 sugar ABC transporter permease [Hungatella hathewayi]GKH33397.1 putative ABC transporter permease protein YurN [Faecalicatena contorta]
MRKKRKLAVPVLFLMPAIILLAVFIVYPTIQTIYLSFYSWKGIANVPKLFVGLKNYENVLTNQGFWDSLKNCMYFLVGGFIILMPLSFILALIITSKMKFTKIMKTAYFMPVMLGVTAVALMWVYMLNPSWGVFAQILSWLGLEEWVQDWLATPTVNIWCVVLVNEWMYAGYNMLIFASGIVAIPSSLYEAAEIDGCSGLKKIWYVTIPLCKNSFKVFSIICITGCIKVFDIIWAMTRGGPNGVSESPGILLYYEAFQYKLYGKSSATGVIMIVLGIVLSLVVNRALKQEEL